jgi:polyhydroxyalkanoate synthase
VYNPPNIEPEISKRVVALATELVTSSKLWGSMGKFLETGVFGANGNTGYLDPENHTDVPLLILAGAADEMAPPYAVLPESRNTGTPGEMRSEILGKDTGYEEDYGHMDLLVGKRVEQEVFPAIQQWIESHDSEIADSKNTQE